MTMVLVLRWFSYEHSMIFNDREAAESAQATVGAAAARMVERMSTPVVLATTGQSERVEAGFPNYAGEIVSFDGWGVRYEFVMSPHYAGSWLHDLDDPEYRAAVLGLDRSNRAMVEARKEAEGTTLGFAGSPR